MTLRTAIFVRPLTSTYLISPSYSGGMNLVSASRSSYMWLSTSKTGKSSLRDGIASIPLGYVPRVLDPRYPRRGASLHPTRAAGLPRLSAVFGHVSSKTRMSSAAQARPLDSRCFVIQSSLRDREPCASNSSGRRIPGAHRRRSEGEDSTNAARPDARGMPDGGGGLRRRRARAPRRPELHPSDG